MSSRSGYPGPSVSTERPLPLVVTLPVVASVMGVGAVWLGAPPRPVFWCVTAATAVLVLTRLVVTVDGVRRARRSTARTKDLRPWYGRPRRGGM